MQQIGLLKILYKIMLYVIQFKIRVKVIIKKLTASNFGICNTIMFFVKIFTNVSKIDTNTIYNSKSINRNA